MRKVNIDTYCRMAMTGQLPRIASTGTNVDVPTTDDFSRGIDALVYGIDPDEERMKRAFPVELFDRNIIDGRAMICSFLALAIGNNQGMGDVEYAKMHDFCVPLKFLRLFNRPSKTIRDMWRVLGRPVVDGGFVVGTIIQPMLGLGPQPFADACYDSWLGGDFVKNDQPQGNQLFAPPKETMPLVADSMKRVQGDTGEAKLFSANISADDHYEMLVRGEFILETFGETPITWPSWSMVMSSDRRRSPLHGAPDRNNTCTTTARATGRPQTQHGYTIIPSLCCPRWRGYGGPRTSTLAPWDMAR